VVNSSQDGQTSAASGLWRFARAELDEGTFELRVDGRVVEVERKPLEVLLCLLRHGNEIVSKERILETVWPGRIVTE
jgi:eukaryotic-like serine/threonine-protein kinase